jgi:hypothetical protein
MAGNGNRKGEVALLAALAAGVTIKYAAEQAGISERTAHRRLAEPAFVRELTQARAALLEQALGQLAAGSVEAVAKLRKLLDHYDGRVMLGAARSILELGSKLHESVELEQRVRRLEGG